MTGLPMGPLALDRPDLLRRGAYIDGRWLDGAGTFDVIDPASGEVIAAVAEGGADLARQAVDAAARCFNDWRFTTVRQRSAILRRWFDLIVKHRDDLARILSWEMGKPLPEARGEIGYGASYVEWFAEEIKRAEGEVLAPPMADRRMLTVKEPVGVVAVITPWNFPMAMIARKMAPALAAGCTIVGKPAEDTPLSSLALAVLAEEAGMPPGAINLVPASRTRTPEVADVWLADDRVRKLSFTGSTPVGRLLARGSAQTLKRVSMELGGDAPFIVFDDADMDIALKALMQAKFRNGGQACIAANRVMVQNGIHDAFVARLLAAVRALTVGAASDGHADIGPLINERALDKVERLVADAVAKGATILTGGARIDRPGFFFQPTLLTGVADGMALSCEEIFGPVIAIQRFATEEEAIIRANATPYGLAAYACTSDHKRIWRLASRLDTGMVGINDGSISTESAPFGGIKQSGYGREGSSHGLDDYQSIKYVCIGGLG